jgi:hypothetical protein
MHMKRLIWLVAMVVLACVAAPALANGDLGPSWRGTAGTTYQMWDFAASSSPAAATSVSNPYGEPTATVATGDFAAGWLDQLPAMGTKTGYWDLGIGGTISLSISNAAQPDGAQDIWLQVVYYEDINDAPTLDITSSGVASLVSEQNQSIEHVATGGDWMVWQSLWTVTPNPGSETITFTSNAQMGSVIDQIVADTRPVAAQPIPEPASFVGLSAGLSLVLARRRLMR